MAGNETHNFDFVMEFSEQAYNELFATIFDTNGFLCSILQLIGAGGICGAFTVNVLMDRPTDVSLPAGARDILDIQISLGEEAPSAACVWLPELMSITAAAITTSSGSTFRTNCSSPRRTLADCQIPPNVVQDVLRNQVRFISLPGIPVDRMTSDPTKLRSADVPDRR